MDVVQPGPAAIVRTLESPGFTTRPPNVGNPGLIPPGIRAAMAPSWGRREFPVRPVSVFALPDVFVVGEGLVFDAALNVVAPSLTQHSLADAAEARERLRAAIAAGQVLEDRGTVLLAQKRGMGNFGHWLIELLPLVDLMLPSLQDRSWSVLVPALGTALDVVIADTLAGLGVPPSTVLRGDGAPRRVEMLVLIDGLTAHGFTVSPLVMATMGRVAAGIAADPPRRLWISRRGERRALWNEAELERVLLGLGWRVLRPGAMPFAAQVAAFKGATRIAGVHGAGLTGLVFAPPGTPVTAFTPAGMPDTFFWLLTTLRGLPYREVRAPHDEAGGGDMPYDAALVLPLPAILAELGDTLPARAETP